MANKKLRIATFVTNIFTTPPPPPLVYAPIDISLELTSHLTERGHEVSYFAPEGSSIPQGKLETLDLPALKNLDYIVPHAKEVAPWRLGQVEMVWNQFTLSEMFARAAQGEFDIIHSHTVSPALPFARRFPDIPTLYTLHNDINPWRDFLYNYFVSDNQKFISISNAQRKSAPQLPYAATIYNGINLSDFKFSSSPEEYLLFVGRLLPRKGVKEAIKVAQKVGKKLVIIGPPDPDNDEYWEKEIKPRLGPNIVHHGYVSRKELFTYYQKAQALLFPIQWEEPFGLVMTEAMACGTPVIAFRRGSVPEVVIDGKTGFIVDTVEEMGEALKKIDSIDRQACRNHVEKNFSIGKMIDSYEQVYYDILDKQSRA